MSDVDEETKDEEEVAMEDEHLEGLSCLDSLWRVCPTNRVVKLQVDWALQQVENIQLPFVNKLFGFSLIDTFPLVTTGMCYCVTSASVLCFAQPAAVQMGIPYVSAKCFTGLLGASCVSLYQSAVTDPGRVPSSWAHEPGGPVFERKKKTNEMRYCLREQVFKPDRAHYCKQLHRNVLRMDHFCPFLLNAVGHRNHKHFVLMLIYTTSATVYADSCLLRILTRKGAALAAVQKLVIANGAFCSTMLCAVLVPFTVFHLSLLFKNITTIEYLAGKTERVNYDMGVWENVSQVFGDRWWLWPLPIDGPSTTGLSFPVADQPEDDVDEQTDNIQEGGAVGSRAARSACWPEDCWSQAREVLNASAPLLESVADLKQEGSRTAATLVAEADKLAASVTSSLWSFAMTSREKVEEMSMIGMDYWRKMTTFQGFSGDETNLPAASAEAAKQALLIARWTWSYESSMKY